MRKPILPARPKSRNGALNAEPRKRRWRRVAPIMENTAAMASFWLPKYVWFKARRTRSATEHRRRVGLRFVSRIVQASFLLCVVLASARAQSAANLPTASEPAYTLHAGTRVVLTDVSVTDAKGNQVHRLPRTAFHLFDNNRPQQLDSFEEHTDLRTEVAAPALPSPNSYNNELLFLRCFEMRPPCPTSCRASNPYP